MVCIKNTVQAGTHIAPSGCFSCDRLTRQQPGLSVSYQFMFGG